MASAGRVGEGEEKLVKKIANEHNMMVSGVSRLIGEVTGEHEAIINCMQGRAEWGHGAYRIAEERAGKRRKKNIWRNR